jgi:hypothetical protein
MGPSSCGETGACSADGQTCVLYPSGTKCGSGTCTGATLSGAYACDGQGLCAGLGSMKCPGHLACASASACATTCTNGGEDCVSDEYTCGESAATMDQCLGVPGAPCTSDTDCAFSPCESGTCE